MSTYKEAHICATNYLRSPHLLETFARRIIDKTWFPSTFRPGFHAERPDAHWFLEQWIPFDFANQATEDDVSQQNDVTSGRLGDWRRAPFDWSHYNPSHDDYQVAGNCNRTLFRCLNVGTRFKLLDEREVRNAFERARSGKPTVLAFTNHDFRDMRNDIADTHALISNVAKDFSDVPWLHSSAKQAARKVLGREGKPPLKLTASLDTGVGASRLEVKSNHATFGSQPFLAIKTRDNRYLSDNFDVQTPKQHWTYTFDADTVPISAINRIGIASNDLNGSTYVINMCSNGSILDEQSYDDYSW